MDPSLAPERRQVVLQVRGVDVLAGGVAPHAVRVAAGDAGYGELADGVVHCKDFKLGM